VCAARWTGYDGIHSGIHRAVYPRLPSTASGTNLEHAELAVPGERHRW